MIPFARATDLFLNRLSRQALSSLQGVPPDALNIWRPVQNLNDINTFYALATHLVGSGEFWVLHAAGGRPLARDRPAEFRAQGDLATLTARYDRWLSASREVLTALTEADLVRVPTLSETTIPTDDPPWTVADCLMHAVEHTALHVGHLQIQRQLWDAERA